MDIPLSDVQKREKDEMEKDATQDRTPQRLADLIRRHKRPTASIRIAGRILPADRCACGEDSGVTNTRPVGIAVYRRRGCAACGERWSTAEVRIADRRASVEAAVVDALVIAKLEELLNRMKSARGIKNRGR